MDVISVSRDDALHCGLLALRLRYGEEAFWVAINILADSVEGPEQKYYHWLGAEADAQQ
jgi:hypothetical protein